MPLARVAVLCESLPGEYLALVGSSRRAGEWKPRQSQMLLETCEQTYPRWMGAWELDDGEHVEFKFVLISNRGFRHEHWEDRIRNRFFQVPKGGLVLTAAFDIDELSSLPAPSCWLHSMLPQSTIHLVVRCETELGERLVVTGSSLSAGEWRPNSSRIELHTNKFIYPLWIGSMGLAVGEQLEFKFVVIGCDETHHWEDTIDNRRLAASCPGADRELVANFNCAESLTRSHSKVRYEAVNFTPPLDLPSICENTDLESEGTLLARLSEALRVGTQTLAEMTAEDDARDSTREKLSARVEDMPWPVQLSSRTTTPLIQPANLAVKPTPLIQPADLAVKPAPLSQWDKNSQTLPRPKRAWPQGQAAPPDEHYWDRYPQAKTQPKPAKQPAIQIFQAEEKPAKPLAKGSNQDLAAYLASWLAGDFGCFPRSFTFIGKGKGGRVERDRQSMTSSNSNADAPLTWDQAQLVM
mmetsp:Transcript_85890/g.152136  ORF Transcript_85890/g.152136 Transcript_85890/m.152136 type:complete len:467 (+) Transcript_85890:47-1447(+)